MVIKNILHNELEYLEKYLNSSILISNTAKHALDFRVFPRRSLGDFGMSCFMINDENLLVETIKYFDGKVDFVFIDIEQKQEINLFELSKRHVLESKLITVKPNDTTLESLDLLIRNHCNDDMISKNILIIGTGNLASKIATRLAERQANVYIQGRNEQKEAKVIDALNLFLPRYTKKIASFKDVPTYDHIDIVISALSGVFEKESILYPYITNRTLVVDVGINNFSKEFIQRSLSKNINVVRLDTRIALPYQFLAVHEYVETFFNDVFGHGNIEEVPVVSGGFIGTEGSIIVDNLKQATQVVGVADGRGGVKEDGTLSQTERNRVQKIEESISIYM